MKDKQKIELAKTVRERLQIFVNGYCRGCKEGKKTIQLDKLVNAMKVYFGNITVENLEEVFTCVDIAVNIPSDDFECIFTISRSKGPLRYSVSKNVEIIGIGVIDI